MAIVRVTLFKVPSKENQQKLLDLYPTLAKTAAKDKKPYIISLQAGLAHEDQRSQGYTIATTFEFKSLDDMRYYDTDCEAHKWLKEQAKPLGLEGPPLTVYYEPTVVSSL
ncbi:uncharacterized protein BP5553_00987 [Venustampulla echinocandica]|uniref:Stress-response A/B barrel domain-containing protein n=1 Tax=Venustampulla echinocandica TaxID=2656787 RepID=A0A370TZT0_9HELO|nr:uncharacterized protein BP5553_00987 [Venustampulla echinocandica]RDL41008.1 hypothetical protein BP5553_00987 [Venustampulla echinocandica]